MFLQCSGFFCMVPSPITRIQMYCIFRAVLIGNSRFSRDSNNIFGVRKFELGYPATSLQICLPALPVLVIWATLEKWKEEKDIVGIASSGRQYDTDRSVICRSLFHKLDKASSEHPPASPRLSGHEAQNSFS